MEHSVYRDQNAGKASRIPLLQVICLFLNFSDLSPRHSTFPLYSRQEVWWLPEARTHRHCNYCHIVDRFTSILTTVNAWLAWSLDNFTITVPKNIRSFQRPQYLKLHTFKITGILRNIYW